MEYKITLKKNNGKTAIVDYKSNMNKQDLKEHLTKTKYIQIANHTINVCAWDSFEIAT